MKCPACSRELVAIQLPQLTVDACKGGCGGIWFHPHELHKVQFQDEVDGEPLTLIEKDDAVQVDLHKKRSCPQCNVIMMQHFVSVKRRVTVDECPKCTGFWLDAGELSQIRSEYHSEADRNADTEKYFSDAFGPQLADHHDDYGNMQKTAKLFSLLRPSTYFSGYKK